MSSRTYCYSCSHVFEVTFAIKNKFFRLKFVFRILFLLCIVGAFCQKAKTKARKEPGWRWWSIEMQLSEDNSKSNLFIQPHLQSPDCLLISNLTNKYAHLSINTYGCTQTHAHTHTSPLERSFAHLAGEIWKKLQVLDLHFNFPSIRHRVWCCSKIACCLRLIPVYRGAMKDGPYIQMWMLSQCMEMRPLFCLVLIHVVCLRFSVFTRRQPTIISKQLICVFNDFARLFLHTFLHRPSWFFTWISSPHPAHSALLGGWEPFEFHQHDSPPLEGCASVGLCLYPIQPLHKPMPPIFPPSCLPSVDHAAGLTQ